MTILNFTLLPDALLQFHSLLACLVKFNEAVSIEADEDSVRLLPHAPWSNWDDIKANPIDQFM